MIHGCRLSELFPSSLPTSQHTSPFAQSDHLFTFCLMRRICLIVVSYLCFILPSPALAMPKTSVSIGSPAFKQFKASFKDVDLFRQPGPQNYMHAIKGLKYLSHRLLCAFYAYLEVFFRVNDGAETAELDRFREITKELLESLDQNWANESNAKESHVIESMMTLTMTLTRSYLADTAGFAEASVADARSQSMGQLDFSRLDESSENSSNSELASCEKQSSAGKRLSGALAVVARSLTRQTTADQTSFSAAAAANDSGAATPRLERPVSMQRRNTFPPAAAADTGVDCSNGEAAAFAATYGAAIIPVTREECGRLRRTRSWRIILDRLSSRQGNGDAPSEPANK